VSFNGSLQGKLRATKIEVRVVLDVPNDSDDKVEIDHANYLKIYHASELMFLLEFCQSKQHINYSNDVNDMKTLAQANFLCFLKGCRSERPSSLINIMQLTEQLERKEKE
jgi:hypothetical protein